MFLMAAAKQQYLALHRRMLGSQQRRTVSDSHTCQKLPGCCRKRTSSAVSGNLLPSNTEWQQSEEIS